MNRNKLDEEDDDTLDSGEHFTIHKKPISQLCDIYLNDSIEGPSSNYEDLLHLLNHAKKADLVRMYMSNLGGDVGVGSRIANALKRCKADIAIFAEAPCYSMGSIIALCGDYLHIQPGSFLMFHNYSMLNFGKGAELEMSVKEEGQFCRKLLEIFCKPFLTKKDMDTICEDKDKYFKSPEVDKEVGKRINRHFPRYKEIEKRLRAL